MALLTKLTPQTRPAAKFCDGSGPYKAQVHTSPTWKLLNLRLDIGHITKQLHVRHAKLNGDSRFWKQIRKERGRPPAGLWPDKTSTTWAYFTFALTSFTALWGSSAGATRTGHNDASARCPTDVEVLSIATNIMEKKIMSIRVGSAHGSAHGTARGSARNSSPLRIDT